MPRVDVSGPLFDAFATKAATRRMSEGITQTLTNLAYRRVHQILRSDLRHPTGYYQSKVVRDIRGSSGQVHDSNVVYGPWLEGVSSRNRETRFKGYFAFRRAMSSVANQRERLSRPHIERMIRDLGGR